MKSPSCRVRSALVTVGMVTAVVTTAGCGLPIAIKSGPSPTSASSTIASINPSGSATKASPSASAPTSAPTFASPAELLDHARTQARQDKGVNVSIATWAANGEPMEIYGRYSTAAPYCGDYSVVLSGKHESGLLMTETAAYASGADIPDGKFARLPDESFRELQRTTGYHSLLAALDLSARALSPAGTKEEAGNALVGFKLTLDWATYTGLALEPGEPDTVTATVWFDSHHRVREVSLDAPDGLIEDWRLDNWGPSQTFVAPPDDYLVPLPDGNPLKGAVAT